MLKDTAKKDNIELPKMSNNQLNVADLTKKLNETKKEISNKTFVDKKIDDINDGNNVFGVGKVIKVNDYILIASGL